jgi:hypothetical protein
MDRSHISIGKSLSSYNELSVELQNNEPICDFPISLGSSQFANGNKEENGYIFDGVKVEVIKKKTH